MLLDQKDQKDQAAGGANNQTSQQIIERRKTIIERLNEAPGMGVVAKDGIIKYEEGSKIDRMEQRKVNRRANKDINRHLPKY